MFRCRPNVPAGGIDHHDAHFRGSLHVDVVNSNTCSCNNLEIFGGCEKLGGDFGLGSDKERFIVGYYLDQLFRREAFPLVDVKCSSEKGEAVGRKFLWTQNFRSSDTAIRSRHVGVSHLCM